MRYKFIIFIILLLILVFLVGIRIQRNWQVKQVNNVSATLSSLIDDVNNYVSLFNDLSFSQSAIDEQKLAELAKIRNKFYAQTDSLKDLYIQNNLIRESIDELIENLKLLNTSFSNLESCMTKNNLDCRIDEKERVNLQINYINILEKNFIIAVTNI